MPPKSKERIDWEESSGELEKILRDCRNKNPDSWKETLSAFKKAVKSSSLLSVSNKKLIDALKNDSSIKAKFNKLKSSDVVKSVPPPAFKWDENSINALFELYNSEVINIAGNSQFFETIFDIFKQRFPTFSGTVGSLRWKINDEIAKLPASITDAVEEKQIEWNTDMAQILNDCTSEIWRETQSMHGMNLLSRNDIYKRICLRFKNKSLISPTIGAIKVQLNRMSLFQRFDFNFENKEPIEVDPSVMTNMPVYLSNLQRYYDFGRRFREKPLFDALCFRCGQLLYGGHKLTLPEDKNHFCTVPVEELYPSERIHSQLPYKKDEFNYYICRNCMNNIHRLLAEVFPLRKTENPAYEHQLCDISQPPAISALSTHNEKSDIALAGMWSTFLQKRSWDRNQFSKTVGTSKSVHRSDEAYYRLRNLCISTDNYRDRRTASSHQKKVRALNWLKRNNPLYKGFLANYETLLRYYQTNSAVEIFGGVDYTKVNKAEKLKELIGEEKVTMLVDCDNVIADEDEMVCDGGATDIVAMAHPVVSDSEKNRAQASLVQGLWVKFNDYSLEAKLFPHLYPYGYGSYRNNHFLYLTRLDFAKMRLLNLDWRWRHDDYWWTHMIDSILKDRIYYFNQNTAKMVKTTSAIDRTAGEIRAQKTSKYYQKLGTRLPATIPGSRTFWFGKYANLIAMCNALGKPTLFVTLTQNDMSPELQSVYKKWDEKYQPSQQHSFWSQNFMSKGKPIVTYPVEAVITMDHYLRDFIDKFLKNKHSPFGTNTGYFIRAEYQQRGAVHYHILLWSEEGTYDQATVVCAEMPRSASLDENGKYDPWTEKLRDMVRRFQTHKCRAQCMMPRKHLRRGTKQKKFTKCRSGFPYHLTNVEFTDADGKRINYIRRKEEDQRIVSYNMELLVHGFRTHNVMKVGDQFPLDYICKYVTKSEKMANIKIPKRSGKVWKYLLRRTMNAPEAMNILLQQPQCMQSHEVVFMSTLFDPRSRVVKRYEHLPQDDKSGNIYYKTPFEKYSFRPDELKKLTFKEFTAEYRYVYHKNTRIEPRPKHKAKPRLIKEDKCDDSDSSNISSSDDDDWFDIEINIPRRKKFKVFKDRLGNTLRKRGKPAITRTEFFYRYGPQQKSWLMQQLLLNVAWTDKELAYLHKINNSLSDLITECSNHNLLGDSSEEDGWCLMEQAMREGVSSRRQLVFAKLLKDLNKLSEDQFATIEQMCADDFPGNADSEDEDSDEEHNFDPFEIAVEKLQHYKERFSETQRRAFELITQRMENNQQTLACITGEAGVGKTFLINALVAYLQEERRDLPFALLAFTGVAAINIGGRTIHSFLKMDINQKCNISYRTMEARLIRDCKVIIIDEISMITRELWDDLRYYLMQFSLDVYVSDKFAYGGKHVLCFGDFAQLPAIGHQLYSSEFFGREFKFMVLREAQRQQHRAFIKVLNKIRVLDFDDEVINFIKAHSSKLSALKTIKDQIDHIIKERKDSSNPKHYENVIILVPRIKQKEEYNRRLLDQIDGEIISCRHNLKRQHETHADQWMPGIMAIDRVRRSDNQPTSEEYGYLKRRLKAPYPEILRLKEGAKVILLRNYNTSAGWVNGTQAIVDRITEDCVEIHMLNDETKTLAVFREQQSFQTMTVVFTRTQFPLDLAYSITVHKAQGLTISGNLYVNMDGMFKTAHPYVAFSRVKEHSQLHLFNINKEKLDKLRKKSSSRPMRRQRLMLQWIDDVDVLGLNKNIPFPSDILCDEYAFVIPEDRPVQEKFDPGDKPPMTALQQEEDELSDLENSDIAANEEDLKYDPYSGSTIVDETNKELPLEPDQCAYESDATEIDSDWEDKEEVDEEQTQIVPSPSGKKLVQQFESMEIDVGPQPKQFRTTETFLRNYSQTAASYLRRLLSEGAFDEGMQRLNTFFHGEMETFAITMQALVQSCLPLYYSGTDRRSNYGYFRSGLDQHFFPRDTSPDGDCFYHAISISLVRNQTLTPVIRFLMVYSFVKYFRETGVEVPPECAKEQIQRTNKTHYSLTLCDLSLSAAMLSSLDAGVPQRLLKQHLDSSAMNTFHYAVQGHVYFSTLFTGRPVWLASSAQEEWNEVGQLSFAKIAYWEKNPICIYYVDNHYVCLLPKSDMVERSLKYRLFCLPFETTERNIVLERVINNRPLNCEVVDDSDIMID